MKLNKKYARELSIEVWQYLYDHPEIETKIQLPEILFDKILNMQGCCPLCEYFYNLENGSYNLGCPLNLKNISDCYMNCFDDIFLLWHYSTNKKSRKKYAGRILKAIKNWEI